MNQRQHLFNRHWLIIIIALIAYVTPWVWHPSAGLSMGAYDFAELLTKRAMDDTLYNTVFALRAQLVLLTWYLALATQRPYFTWHWWAQFVACGLLVIAQLPALTFVTELNDPNQQQQALLAWQSAIGVVFGLSGLLWGVRHQLWLVIALAGIGTTLYGLVNSIETLQAYQATTTIGAGGIMLVVIYGGIAVWNIRQLVVKS